MGIGNVYTHMAIFIKSVIRLKNDTTIYIPMFQLGESVIGWLYKTEALAKNGVIRKDKNKNAIYFS